LVRYEYKVVPAPTRGVKSKTARTPEDRFAHALAEVMNELGAEGWDYVRCDSLPSEERTGLTGRTTVYRNLLVFRRAITAKEAVADTTVQAAQPVSFAARVAATLRPGAGDTAAPPPVPLRAETDRTATATVPARPIGPADRGVIGDAPRIIAGEAPAEGARSRADGTAPG
jgi:hypothetical protein